MMRQLASGYRVEDFVWLAYFENWAMTEMVFVNGMGVGLLDWDICMSFIHFTLNSVWDI